MAEHGEAFPSESVEVEDADVVEGNVVGHREDVVVAATVDYQHMRAPFLLQVHHRCVRPRTWGQTGKVFDFVKGDGDLGLIEILAAVNLDELSVCSVVGANKPKVVLRAAFAVDATEDVHTFRMRTLLVIDSYRLILSVTSVGNPHSMVRVLCSRSSFRLVEAIVEDGRHTVEEARADLSDCFCLIFFRVRVVSRDLTI